MKRPRAIEAIVAEARIATRGTLVEVARLWGEQRGVDVRELLFRLKTAPVKVPRAEDDRDGR